MKKTFRKYKKIMILFALLCMFTMNHTLYAVDFSQADTFISTGQEHAGIAGENLTTVGSEFSAIGNILTYLGAGILVGATAYMGILYIVSPPEKQAKLKQQLIGLVVSAIVIFGAYGIWSMIVKVLDTTIG